MIPRERATFIKIDHLNPVLQTLTVINVIFSSGMLKKVFLEHKFQRFTKRLHFYMTGLASIPKFTPSIYTHCRVQYKSDIDLLLTYKGRSTMCSRRAFKQQLALLAKQVSGIQLPVDEIFIILSAHQETKCRRGFLDLNLLEGLGSYPLRLVLPSTVFPKSTFICVGFCVKYSIARSHLKLYLFKIFI